MPTTPSNGYKGIRGAHTIRPDRRVSNRLKIKAERAGASSLSQYVADLLAIHVGLPELAVELTGITEQEVLPLAI